MSEELASMKAQVYKDPRPAEYFDRFHERTRTRKPDWVYEFVRMLTTLFNLVFFRARSISSDSVPPTGPVILAPNHFSFNDHFFVAMFQRRKVQFMAKSQLFKRPLQFIFDHGGVFPVRRGYKDEEAFISAQAVLARGGTVAMYCEGGRSRTGDLGDKPKPGIGRLTLESGAKVVPVAIHGSSKVRNWKRLQFPQVTVHYGDPLSFEHVSDPSRERQQAVAEEIFAEIKTLYAGLERHGRRGVVQRVRAERRQRRTAPA
ncbi:MAG: 1-acyl-sn-glycerol-3-phosphate acyltransferase [Actinomycetota bacterium]|nr:1-acyl-sn-glycerol-3-phosphate acyltransferase [Actinomycetota bacterium]